MKEITIQVRWNDESAAWLATSDDVAGLVVESSSYQELVEIVHDLLPDLVEHPAQSGDAIAIPYQLISHHTTSVSAS